MPAWIHDIGKIHLGWKPAYLPGISPHGLQHQRREFKQHRVRQRRAGWTHEPQSQECLQRLPPEHWLPRADVMGQVGVVSTSAAMCKPTFSFLCTFMCDLILQELPSPLHCPTPGPLTPPASHFHGFHTTVHMQEHTKASIRGAPGAQEWRRAGSHTGYMGVLMPRRATKGKLLDLAGAPPSNIAQFILPCLVHRLRRRELRRSHYKRTSLTSSGAARFNSSVESSGSSADNSPIRQSHAYKLLGEPYGERPASRGSDVNSDSTRNYSPNAIKDSLPSSLGGSPAVAAGDPPINARSLSFGSGFGSPTLVSYSPSNSQSGQYSHGASGLRYTTGRHVFDPLKASTALHAMHWAAYPSLPPDLTTYYCLLHAHVISFREATARRRAMARRRHTALLPHLSRAGLLEPRTFPLTGGP